MHVAMIDGFQDGKYLESLALDHTKFPFNPILPSPFQLSNKSFYFFRYKTCLDVTVQE